MYIPKHFDESDRARVDALIRDYGFATLIGAKGDEVHVTHAPLMYDAASNVLVGHIARANPHDAALADGARALAIFHGPHAYISPTWYVDENPRVPNVPTWNYAAVHITGTVKRIDDEHRKWDIVTALSAQYEAANSPPWDPRSEGDHKPKLGVIVGFEIAIDKVEAKFKLSQNRSAADQQSVIAKLSEWSHPDGKAMAELMRGNLAKPK